MTSSHYHKQSTRKIHILIELQLVSSFEYRPDRAVLLRQPSLVILLTHFRRWRGNSTSHPPSSPTSSPSPLASADTAPREESASSRCPAHFLLDETSFAVGLLLISSLHAAAPPPTSSPLGDASAPLLPVCSVDCSASCSRCRSCRFCSIAAANSRSTSSAPHLPTLHSRMML